MGLLPKNDTLQGKIQSVLLSIITAGIIGCFSFLWNVNTILTSIQGDTKGHQRAIDNLQTSINQLRLDAIDDRKEFEVVKEKVVRIEALQRLEDHFGVKGK